MADRSRSTGIGYETGIGVASVSTVRYYLGGTCRRLTGRAGIDDNVDAVGPEGGTVTFSVIGDGEVLFESGSVARHTTIPLDVDVSGVRDLRLVVGDDGDGGYDVPGRVGSPDHGVPSALG